MVLTTSSVQNLNRLAKLHQLYFQEEDIISANRIKELLKKAYSSEFSISFCGHYSAGKSSMINALMNKPILPASPIPTSANLVRIRSGNNTAKITLHNGEAFLYQEAANLKEIQSYCKNSQDVKEIEICLSGINLPDNVLLMDTPGIDSTDQAHLLATESSIHLADLIFYVVDYNHVQSEVNLEFMKQLVTKGKEVALIVNQMDKHQEAQLKLADFKESVQRAFQSYGVPLVKIFFTSVKDKKWQYNDLGKLQQYIKEQMDNKHAILPKTTEQSCLKIQKDHQLFRENRKKEQLTPYLNQLSILTEKEQFVLEETLERKTIELTKRQNAASETYKQWETTILSTIENAYIMPYQNRELARAYLQTEQKNFKMGLFTTKQKVQKEKEKRLAHFLEQLEHTVKIQLVAPLIEFFEQTANNFENANMEVLGKVRVWKSSIKDTSLKQLVNDKADLSENYLLVYCEEVEKFIKRKIKKEAIQLLGVIGEDFQKANANKTKEIQGEIAVLEELIAAKNNRQKIIEAWEKSEKQEYRLLHEKTEDHPLFLDLIKEKKAKPITGSILKAVETKEIAPTAEKTIENKAIPEKNKVLKQLQFLSDHAKEIKGFKQIAANLQKKAGSIINKQYTICLFGAFSAGKSSFANALLDYPLLPVSPNPTTAAINRIVPVDNQHPHGTVSVKWKNEEQIWSEIKEQLQLFKKTAANLTESIPVIEELIREQTADFPAIIRYFQFFLQGYKKNKELLGKHTQTDYTQLERYVAIEENSCLIANIDVYFDCEFTKKGMILIDTPGGDSINTRHTEVSFEYMKEADSIIYVSYYNHSFSKADKSFLMQLGRMKDAMETDKMFFIVNAIDLAQDEPEIQAVTEYLTEQLQLHGIRNPKISSVSSLYYQDKSFSDRMIHFKEKLFAFIEEDWNAMMLRSAKADCEKTVELLQKFVQSSLEKKAEKHQEAHRLQEEHHKIAAIIQEFDTNYLKKKIQMEIEEQLFYVKQRMFFRFNDFLVDAFHPSLLKGEDKNNELQRALDQFLRTFSYEMEQELRATTVRIENFYAKKQQEAFYGILNKLHEVNEEIMLQFVEMSKSDAKLTFHAPFREMEYSLFKKALVHFKNPKSFFEKNDRKKLGDEIQLILDEHSQSYMKQEIETLSSVYLNQWNKESIQKRSEFLLQAADYYEGKEALFTEEEQVEKIVSILKEIKEIE
ncbi:dynamin family protein [Niallia sp. NCCP-28]|uniref:dynamin family protein n=1 Tax=Niallia sp. NCCP-28 TaxID=2934712 RepID=UPI00207F57D0|nr:dynamin family protein [Niallia sp. NCCP-28]GKU80945.1 GTPase [Niallia sp. NCCP-28]